MFAYTKIMQAMSGAVAVVTDAYFNLVTLLLNTSSTNGAQNNTFLDSSTNNFTITRNGNTTQGTFTPFSQTGWSNYTSSVASNYINFTTSPGTLFQFTGDFTIEMWIFPTLLGTGESLWVTNDGSSSYLAFNITTTTYDIFLNSTGVTASITSGVNLNQWNHCAMVRSGSTITVYTNGVAKGTTTNSSTLGYANPSLNRNGGGGSSASWYMSNLRIVKGTAVYTSNFTPSAAPLTAITGTSLLTCQSNRFVDNSANALVATVTGTPSVQAFSPFAPTAAYDTSVVGGSGYFDGSGDYLTVPAGSAFAPGTGDFTVDGWIYPTSGSAIQRFYAQSTSGTNYFLCEADVPNKTIRFIGTSSGGGTPIVSAATLQLNAWNNFCVSRTSGTVTVWCNGSAGTPTSNTTNFNDTSYTPTISGYSHSTGSEPIIGYLSGLRYIKGTALSGATVPTSPPTAVTNTSLLTNFTNAGIYDSAAKNDLETVGNAQVSTTQAKWGTTSMYFDSSGDQVKTKAQIAIGSGDYTIEGWIYGTSTSATYIFDMRETSQYISAFTVGATFYVNLGATLDIVASTSFSQNTWTHFAIVRSGSGTNNTSVFIAGSRVLQRTDTTNYSTNPTIYVGNDNTNSYSWNGYIDDFRITKGYARYSGSTYTVPTAAFPVQ